MSSATQAHDQIEEVSGDVSLPTQRQDATARFDRLLAPWMWLLTVVFLLVVGSAVEEFRTVPAVDFESISDPLELQRVEAEFEVALYRWGNRMQWYAVLAGVLWFAYPIELAAYLLVGAKRWTPCIGHCLFPPLRLGGKDHSDGKSIWLPMLGWRVVNRSLFREVERAFSGPMIVVALMILPLLAIDLYWLEKIKDNPASYSWLDEQLLHMAVNVGTVIIWMAFTVEFIVMFSIVHNKFQYLRKHWVDLAIICLPMISFARVLRVSQLVRLQQVMKITRMYRLRGLSMRMLRGLMALDMISRMLRISPERKIRMLTEKVEEKQHEIEELEKEIARHRQKINARA